MGGKLRISQVPEPVTDHDPPVVAAEGHVRVGAARHVSADDLDGTPGRGLEVPDEGLLIVIAREEEAAVGAEAEILDRFRRRVAEEKVLETSLPRRPPEHERPVGRTSRVEDAHRVVGREGGQSRPVVVDRHIGFEISLDFGEESPWRGLRRIEIPRPDRVFEGGKGATTVAAERDLDVDREFLHVEDPPPASASACAEGLLGCRRGRFAGTGGDEDRFRSEQEAAQGEALAGLAQTPPPAVDWSPGDTAPPRDSGPSSPPQG